MQMRQSRHWVSRSRRAATRNQCPVESRRNANTGAQISEPIAGSIAAPGVLPFLEFDTLQFFATICRARIGMADNFQIGNHYQTLVKRLLDGWQEAP